jgi:hypothetical protein
MPDTDIRADLVSLELAQEFFRGPVTLRANSPDPAGREIRVVDDVADTSLLASGSVARSLALSIALPIRSYQTGAGIGAVTSQSPSPPTTTAVRDPRIGLAYSFEQFFHVRGLGLKSYLETSLPLGDSAIFAGDRSLVVSPKILLSGHYDRFFGELSLGARLRQTSTIGDTRIGSQALLALGFGVDALPHDLLFVGVEAWALPALTSTTAQQVAATESVTLTPAEWLVSAQSRFASGSRWLLQIGGGSGLPLSSVHHVGAGSEHFLGVTTPEFRFIAAGRYEFSLSDL